MKNTPQVKKLNAHHIPQGDQCYKLQFTNLQKPDILKAKNPPFLLPLCAFSFLSMTIQSTAHPTGHSQSTGQAVSLHNLLPTSLPTC